MAVKEKNSKLRKVWRWIRKVFLILFISQFVYIVALKWINPPFTLTQVASILTGDGLKRDYVDADEMSPYARLAVICSEDQIFPDHSGFDWKNIKKAMEYNKKKPGRIHHVRGASTISQQVAKNVFLWQGRDWIRKGLEVYFTQMIEWIWGKDRILEMYLNVIEMGEGIYGIEAASQAYFNKPAQKLTRAEAARIAACLPNPVLYKVQPPSPYVQVKSGWILRQMTNLEADPDVRKLVYPSEKAEVKNKPATKKKTKS